MGRGLYSSLPLTHRFATIDILPDLGEDTGPLSYYRHGRALTTYMTTFIFQTTGQSNSERCGVYNKCRPASLMDG